MKNFYVSLIKVEDKVYLMLNRNKQIHGFKTEKEGLSFFEDGYNNCHKRSYESSMSACVNGMFFQPSIIKVEGLDDIRSFITDNEKDGINVKQISNISGSFIVILADTDLGKKKWEEGRKPKLIS